MSSGGLKRGSSSHVLAVAPADAFTRNTILVSVKLAVAVLVGGNGLFAGFE